MFYCFTEDGHVRPKIFNNQPFRESAKGVLRTAKKGGGGRKRTVSAQCEVRLKMATAGLRQISRSCALRLSRVTKLLQNAGNAKKKGDPEGPGTLRVEFGLTQSREIFCVSRRANTTVSPILHQTQLFATRCES